MRVDVGTRISKSRGGGGGGGVGFGRPQKVSDPALNMLNPALKFQSQTAFSHASAPLVAPGYWLFGFRILLICDWVRFLIGFADSNQRLIYRQVA